MNKRIAKKISRNSVADWLHQGHRYTNAQRAMANRILDRLWCRTLGGELTRGYRWGRWDPHLPVDPDEVPF